MDEGDGKGGGKEGRSGSKTEGKEGRRGIEEGGSRCKERKVGRKKDQEIVDIPSTQSTQ